MSTPTLEALHRSRVSSLYRRALKSAYDWSGRRDIWRHQAMEIRAKFEANRNVSSLRQREALCRQTEEELWVMRHPDPHKFPSAPGGIAYHRHGVPPHIISTTESFE
ncbi:hypothetical protein BJ684DRAFT_22078 [Piptocephalis cylindrospora]|uniref:NADH dehydrogenase [ubiquinone] 1 beta subcomplex subunit 9 n=1 Tax=Piptocephalis cylindrospora TaxID=1907219 RepID=A0A4P9XZ30_9FUNG|nr:hypothetical protein BJ684DRAFT_22078 [Piptocephalis cylindrospora]|eukprot:RKP11362.1 hypothetical protein BJ684DRAFT_22078 [Piptocephalis cylindrospora]